MAREILREVVGNSHLTPWCDQLKGVECDYLELDQWTAQKSRLVACTRQGEEVAVALNRNERLHDGDILRFDPAQGKALVVHLKLNEVLVLELTELLKRSSDEQRQRLFELGHAIGNQHWPAVMHHQRIYIPLTVDRKVMLGVMKSHPIEGVCCRFEPGSEVIPYLSPHEIRRLFGGASHHSHTADEHP